MTASPTPTGVAVITTGPSAGETPATDTDEPLEIGGLAPLELLGLLAAVALVLAGFFLFRWFSGPPVLTIETEAADGLRVSAGSHDVDFYETGDGAVSFEFTRNELWTGRESDTAVSFDDVFTIENTSGDVMAVTAHGDEDILETLDLLARNESESFSANGFELGAGERVTLSVTFPPEFEPDGDVSVFFEGGSPSE